jgi:flavin reductase (NADH)/flavin reductase
MMQNNELQPPDWGPNAALAAMATVTPEDFKSGMRHFAASVSIIAAKGAEARTGLTATAVCSVTADPPRLVVFVNKTVAAAPEILKTGALSVNVLASDQEEVSKAFAGMIKGVVGEDRFSYGTWDELASGTPTLVDALVNFDCRVIKVFDESTHHAFLCEVLSTRERTGGEALIYLNGAFRSVAQ